MTVFYLDFSFSGCVSQYRWSNESHNKEMWEASCCRRCRVHSLIGTRLVRFRRDNSRMSTITAPTVWNSLPPAARVSISNDTFHRHLKGHSRATISSRPTNSLAAELFRLGFGFDWPWCTVTNYIYFFSLSHLSCCGILSVIQHFTKSNFTSIV